MALTLLEVTNLRILKHALVHPGGGLNVLVGPNGSGKTSLLEGIHMLGMGRSFRAGPAAHPIRRGETSLNVRGCWRSEEGGQVLLGIERGPEVRRIRVNGSTCDNAGALAQVLPLQAVLPDTRYLFLHSARFRRGVFDWGLFHVEPGFYETWTRYQRALRQRNAALRTGRPLAILEPWEQTLAETGEYIEELRARYLEPWQTLAAQYSEILLPGMELRLQRRRGWSEAQSLADVLSRERERDRREGYTRAGIHRADLQLTLEAAPLRECASQGQQMLAVLALRLAQVELLMRTSGRRCLLMLDDVLNQLDRERREALLARIAQLGVQTFVTVTEIGAWEASHWPEPRVFHVEQGAISATKPP
jgi:DNA replication and repair protein RecF